MVWVIIVRNYRPQFNSTHGYEYNKEIIGAQRAMTKINYNIMHKTAL